MTLPGAETIKGGIMGDDCFLCTAGEPFVVVGAAVKGIMEFNCAGIVSMGDESGVWLACDEEVLRG